MPVASPIELLQDAAKIFSEAVQRVADSSNFVSAHHAQPLQLITDAMRTDLHTFISIFDTDESTKEEDNAANLRVVPATDTTVPQCETPVRVTPPAAPLNEGANRVP
jgi:hypothetical protein